MPVPSSGISVNHQPLSPAVMPKRVLPIFTSTCFAFGAQTRNEIMRLGPFETKEQPENASGRLATRITPLSKVSPVNSLSQFPDGSSRVVSAHLPRHNTFSALEFVLGATGL